MQSNNLTDPIRHPLTIQIKDMHNETVLSPK